LDCKDTCDEENLRLIVSWFGELKVDGSVGIPRLLEIVQNKELPNSVRLSAVSMLGGIGEKAQITAPILINVKVEEKDVFEGAIFFALKNMRYPGIAKEIANFLPEKQSGFFVRMLLRDLAAMGRDGRDAGPKLESILNNGDQEMKLGAANTLGFIQYENAYPALISALANRQDWRLVFVASKSLAMIRSKSALPALLEVANSHWYPVVRDMAILAIREIERPNDSKSLLEIREFRYGFEQAMYNHGACGNLEYEHIEEKTNVKLYSGKNTKALEALSYELAEISYEYDKETNQSYEGDTIYRKMTPSIALKYTNGWLTGSNRGEWGGELGFHDEDGNFNILLNHNVEDIYETSSGIIALVGLSHLGSNYGSIYKISTGPDGNPFAEIKLSLPGAAHSSWPTRDESIIINTSGGSLIYTKDGDLTMAICNE